MSDWRKDAKRRLKERQAGKTIKINQGDNCVRVAPDKKDLNPDGSLKKEGIKHPPMREFMTHRDVGPDKAFNIRCGLDMDGNGKCWLCRKRLEVEKTKPAYAEALKPQANYLVNASNYDPDDKRFSPFKPWYVSNGGRLPLSVRVGQKLLSERKDYLHPAKGHNINIHREGMGFKGKDATRYTEVEGDEYPTAVPKELLAAMKDLDEYVPKYSEEDQKKAFYGTPDEDEERPRRSRDEDEDKPKRRSRDEDEEESEEESADEEESTEEDSDTEDAEESTDSDDAEEGDEEESEEASDDEESTEEESDEESDDSEEYDEEEEEPEPEPDDEEEEEEEPPPPPKKKAKPAPAPPPAKKPSKPAPPPAKKPAKKK